MPIPSLHSTPSGLWALTHAVDTWGGCGWGGGGIQEWWGTDFKPLPWSSRLVCGTSFLCTGSPLAPLGTTWQDHQHSMWGQERVCLLLGQTSPALCQPVLNRKVSRFPGGIPGLSTFQWYLCPQLFNPFSLLSPTINNFSVQGVEAPGSCILIPLLSTQVSNQQSWRSACHTQDLYCPTI